MTLIHGRAVERPSNPFQGRPPRSPIVPVVAGALIVGLLLVRVLPRTAPRPLSLASYARVRPGMRYLEVVRTVGVNGVRADGSTASGVTYRWRNQDGSTMTATFQDNRLVFKSETGLH